MPIIKPPNPVQWADIVSVLGPPEGKPVVFSRAAANGFSGPTCFYGCGSTILEVCVLGWSRIYFYELAFSSAVWFLSLTHRRRANFSKLGSFGTRAALSLLAWGCALTIASHACSYFCALALIHNLRACNRCAACAQLCPIHGVLKNAIRWLR